MTEIALVYVRETVVTRLAKTRRACREGYGVNIKMDKLPFCFWWLTRMNHNTHLSCIFRRYTNRKETAGPREKSL